MSNPTVVKLDNATITKLAMAMVLASRELSQNSGATVARSVMSTLDEMDIMLDRMERN